MKSKITINIVVVLLLLAVLMMSAVSARAQNAKQTPMSKSRLALKQQSRRQPNPETAIIFWLKTGLDDPSQNLIEEKFYDVAQVTFGWNIIFVRNEQELRSYLGRDVHVLDFQTTMEGVGAERLDSTGLAVGRAVLDRVYREGRRRLPDAAGETTDIIVGDAKQEGGAYGNHFRRYFRANVTVLAPPAVPVRLTFYWGVEYAYQSRRDVLCAKIDRFDHNFATVQKAGMDNEVDLGCIVQNAVDMGIRRETFSQALQEAWVGRWLTQIKTQAEKKVIQPTAVRADDAQKAVSAPTTCNGDPLCGQGGAVPEATQPAAPAKPTLTSTPVQPPAAEPNGNTGRTGFAGFTPTTDVGEGSEGAKRALGFFCSGSGDAWFTQQWRPGWAFRVNGPMMTKTISDFQSQNGLVVNGQLDAPTRRVLNDIWKANPRLFPDMAQLAASPAPCRVK